MRLSGSKSYLAARALVLVVLLGSLALLLADRASASEHPVWPATLEAVCADGSLPALDPQEDDYEVLAELRRGLLDVRDHCEALYELNFEAAEALLERAGVSDARLEGVNARLDAIEAHLDGGLVVVDDGQGLDVREVEPQAAGEASTEAIEASALVTKEALWAIAGLMSGLFTAYGFYRQMMPRG